jgi:hypothetical protein
MEIDLLRGGAWALPDRSLLNPAPPGRVYHNVGVTRSPRLSRCEFYVLPLRERLPAIRVPLRRTDPDAALDLQALTRGTNGAAIPMSSTTPSHLAPRYPTRRPCGPKRFWSRHNNRAVERLG